MKRYRKKPVVIEAVQFIEGSENPSFEFLGINKVSLDQPTENDVIEIIPCAPCRCFSVYIKTLEGKMKVSNGDYIIKGVNGEFYPCKPDIFEKTYDVYEGWDSTEQSDKN